MNTRREACGKYKERPEPCRRCGCPAWWNGRRTVSGVHMRGGGDAEHVSGQTRRRACCPSKDCPVGSWTVYDGDAYPHRTFWLEVVVSAVVQLVMFGATMTAVAARHLCSRDSVRRWARWVERLAEPAELARLCMRIDPDGLPAAGAAAPTTPVAQQVLQLLERLADLLATGGVALRRQGSGLVRILVDQLVRFGVVFRLTKSSPPLRAAPTRSGASTKVWTTRNAD